MAAMYCCLMVEKTIRYKNEQYDVTIDQRLMKILESK